MLAAPGWSWPAPSELSIDWDDSPDALEYPLQERRVDLVVSLLLRAGVTSVLDLGCGEGDLLAALARQEAMQTVVGMDLASSAVSRARQRLGAAGLGDRVDLIVGSFTDRHAALRGFDAATLVETIEHIDPGRLGQLEQAIFDFLRPQLVIVTTPNQEYNPYYGLRDGQMRHPDHRFEWCRARFRSWAWGVARRNGYKVHFTGAGLERDGVGPPTQIAVFRRAPG